MRSEGSASSTSGLMGNAWSLAEALNLLVGHTSLVVWVMFTAGLPDNENKSELTTHCDRLHGWKYEKKVELTWDQGRKIYNLPTRTLQMRC